MKLINPSDLGVTRIVEWTQKVEINKLLRKANVELKKQLLQSSLDLNGTSVLLSYSKTRFGGHRAWFICPKCGNRVGTLYLLNNQVLCRICGNLKYKNQRYSGMIEKEI